MDTSEDCCAEEQQQQQPILNTETDGIHFCNSETTLISILPVNVTQTNPISGPAKKNQEDGPYLRTRSRCKRNS